MLVVTELSEAVEALRKGNFALIEHKNGNEFELFVKDTFEDEIADSLIRILDLCSAMRINIDFHVIEKMKYNATRPALHGKSF